MSATELKPCPFCGGHNLEIRRNFIDGDPEVFCHGSKEYACDAVISGNTEEMAISYWNTRATSEADALRARNAKLEAALESLSHIHDGNPSNALADIPPLDYARHMLFEARQIARAAFKGDDA